MAACIRPLQERAYRLLIASCTLLFACSTAVQGQEARFTNTLMPQPSELRVSGAPVILSSGFTVSLHGAPSPILQRAVWRTLDRMEEKTGIQLDKNLQTPGAASFDISVQDTTTARPKLGTDESYSLDVQDGHIFLKAPTVFGALHGLETLLQLVQPDESKFIVPPVHIVDAPRFPWRGLLLDPGRRFVSVSEVMRTLDGMAMVKMNVLHWHLTEDQGFRIESRRFPKLHELGSDGLYYTQDQVRSIVQYASDRGIRVVPEFDMPGHSTSWMVGYPELASQPGPYQVRHENRIFDAVMDPTRESTFRFLDTFFAEMTGLFPDEYVHIGGDESNGKDWKANPAIVRFMEQHHLDSTNALQAYFNTRVQTILKKHGRQMVGWDEILQPNLPPDVVIQNWHGSEFLINGARAGHRGIFSKPYYLDHMRSAAEMYAADPLPPDSGLSVSQAKLVLGGEACMWGEQVSDLTIDSRIWPRSAAIAERLWSPETTRDAADMYRRLAVTSLRLDALGLTHISTPQRGLRQLAGSDAGAQKLAVLTSFLQPVDFHERAEEQHTSPLTPIGQLVDFTTPDPPARENFRALVDAYLHDSDPIKRQVHGQQLASIFHGWIEAAPGLDAMAAQSPLLGEIKARRAELPELGLLALQALGYIDSHQSPPANWASAQQALLQKAREHTDLVDFVQLDPLNDLVQAASTPR